MRELQEIIVQKKENVNEYTKVNDVVLSFIDNKKSQHMPSPIDFGHGNVADESQISS